MVDAPRLALLIDACALAVRGVLADWNGLAAAEVLRIHLAAVARHAARVAGPVLAAALVVCARAIGDVHACLGALAVMRAHERALEAGGAALFVLGERLVIWGREKGKKKGGGQLINAHIPTVPPHWPNCTVRQISSRLHPEYQSLLNVQL